MPVSGLYCSQTPAFWYNAIHRSIKLSDDYYYHYYYSNKLKKEIKQTQNIIKCKKRNILIVVL